MRRQDILLFGGRRGRDTSAYGTQHALRRGQSEGNTRTGAAARIKAIKAKCSEGLFDAVRRASAYFNGNSPEKGVLLAAYGNLIAAFVSAYSGGKEYSPVVKALMESIELNFGDQTYSLENAIRALPLNYDYIRKLFLKETGATPREYLEQKRMERARDIILSGATNKYSEFTVSQIAEACGFAEPLYFSKVFKKYYGVSPSRFGENRG